MNGGIRATLAELNAVLPSQFPSSDSWPVVTHLDGDTLRMHWEFDSTLLRPGNTISGPTMMKLADIVAYISVLAARGTDCQAVTSSLTIHFLRRPPAADLEAVGRVRLGGARSWSIAVEIYSAGSDKPVADALVGYTILSAEDPAQKSSTS